MHIGNLHFEVNIRLFHTIASCLHQNERGDLPFLFHVFEENTALRGISKIEEFFIVQFWNIPVKSQS